MTHEKLVARAVAWLRRYRCGVVLSEQSCASGETPDAIGWKRACHSVVVECKISRADFLADREKPFRSKSEKGMGCERYYLAPAGTDPRERIAAGMGTARTAWKGSGSWWFRHRRRCVPLSAFTMK